ncbi:hypothetical protein G4B88_005260 [Cannabis sativa]|uniref:DUF4283 domain-containing protein n=1 Tax=Cannabis sativa TaxID=3483 RepID=A0A7J6DYE8_CANSA|nr:hypothetical protein G4B88_005260 [Cannabis sativa]
MPWPSWLTPTEVKFDRSPFWVRLSGIPPFYWNKTNLEELAARLGSSKRGLLWITPLNNNGKFVIRLRWLTIGKLGNLGDNCQGRGVGDICPFEDTATLVIRKAPACNLLMEPKFDQQERDADLSMQQTQGKEVEVGSGSQTNTGPSDRHQDHNKLKVPKHVIRDHKSLFSTHDCIGLDWTGQN